MANLPSKSPCIRSTTCVGFSALGFRVAVPDANFVLAARFHGQLHPVEQLPELIFNTFGHDVFGDLGAQTIFLRCAVGDDLLNGSVDIFVGIE